MTPATPSDNCSPVEQSARKLKRQSARSRGPIKGASLVWARRKSPGSRINPIRTALVAGVQRHVGERPQPSLPKLDFLERPDPCARWALVDRDCRVVGTCSSSEQARRALRDACAEGEGGR